MNIPYAEDWLIEDLWTSISQTSGTAPVSILEVAIFIQNDIYSPCAKLEEFIFRLKK